MSELPQKPVTLLIAALGGEGGGVLSDWIVASAMACDFPVQCTSIAGVAQRTGATTYYLEIYPRTWGELDGLEPVMSLTPNPGDIDVVLASELLEAARMAQNGFVDAARTSVIASTHRVYVISERSAMSDGRLDAQHLQGSISGLAAHAWLFDMAQVAATAGSQLNAVMLGALSASGLLPIGSDVFCQSIAATGKSVAANVSGFQAGVAAFEAARAAAGEGQGQAPQDLQPAPSRKAGYPCEVQVLVDAAVARLTDYQDPDYAALYLKRLAAFYEVQLGQQANGTLDGLAEPFRATQETARHLALLMSYEDVIRVAQLKTRAARFARVRSEAGARTNDLLHVTEFLKPGLDEFCSLMPAFLASPIRNWARQRNLQHRFNVGMHVRTTTVTGFVLMRCLAALRVMRRRTSRYAEQQALIERWLAAVAAAAQEDAELAAQVAECATLVKGYGDTFVRGRENFLRILQTLVEGGKASQGGQGPELAERIRQARKAALADPQGDALDRALGEHSGGFSRPQGAGVAA